MRDILNFLFLTFLAAMHIFFKLKYKSEDELDARLDVGYAMLKNYYGFDK